MKRTLIGIGLSIAIALPAEAQTWKFIAKSATTQANHYIDSDSIQTSANGDINYFWTLAINPVPKKGIKATKIYYSMSCSSKVWRIRKLIDLNNDGKVLYQSKPGYTGNADRIYPKTVGEEYWRALCD